MKGLPIRAVLFDLDDTLISEADYQRSADAALAKHLSARFSLPTEQTAAAIREARGVPRSRFIQALLPAFGVAPDDNETRELVQIQRNHAPDISWHPEVLPTLERLRQDGIKVGIITDGYAETQHAKLLSLKADDHFEAIVVSDDLGRDKWKPSPAPFLEACRILGVEPAATVYVGDNPEKDFAISASLPIRTIRLTLPGQLKSDRPYLHDIREFASIASLSELPLLISSARE